MCSTHNPCAFGMHQTCSSCLVAFTWGSQCQHVTSNQVIKYITKAGKDCIQEIGWTLMRNEIMHLHKCSPGPFALSGEKAISRSGICFFFHLQVSQMQERLLQLMANSTTQSATVILYQIPISVDTVCDDKSSNNITQIIDNVQKILCSSCLSMLHFDVLTE